MTIAAVDAMLASTHVAATTLTVLQQLSAGRPVVGSMMWCRTTPPRVQRLTVVLEVATAPDVMLIASSVSSMEAALSSLVWIDQPWIGPSPSTAISPPTLPTPPPPPPPLLPPAPAR